MSKVFEFKIDLQTGEVDPKTSEPITESVTVILKDYGDVPGRVSRRNIGNVEGQIWAALEWGLIEPKHWPQGTSMPGQNILDDIPQREITNMYMEWQKAAGL